MSDVIVIEVRLPADVLAALIQKACRSALVEQAVGRARATSCSQPSEPRSTHRDRDDNQRGPHQ